MSRDDPRDDDRRVERVEKVSVRHVTLVRVPVTSGREKKTENISCYMTLARKNNHASHWTKARHIPPAQFPTVADDDRHPPKPLEQTENELGKCAPAWVYSVHIWELWGGVSESLKYDKARGKNLQGRTATRMKRVKCDLSGQTRDWMEEGTLISFTNFANMAMNPRKTLPKEILKVGRKEARRRADQRTRKPGRRSRGRPEPQPLLAPLYCPPREDYFRIVSWAPWTAVQVRDIMA
ncbi:hypothetical protein DFH08DRAFT_934118 [Mycena albidolilacea]|uniref:Uncharacterized protein n=1 Tax=Mycena albidolilacea TaxID=1033008 RepID=A0AAD7A9I2_9AGAR|nr:hypothetical protein DFH08DRAFT_934118 [Mycena albidolilacea]